jgi:hypothetical protein
MRQMHQKSASGEPKRLAERPVLGDAIDRTLRTIEDRTKLYRCLVAAVSVASIASLVLAAVFRQWLLLASLIILAPLTGGFFFFDCHLVLRWRREILEMARWRGLDVATFLKTISGFRFLPPNSLKAMLSTLPGGNEELRQQIPQPEPAVVDEFETLERKNARRILLGTGLLTLTLICLIGGASCGSVALLLIGTTLGVLVFAFGRR